MTGYAQIYSCTDVFVMCSVSMLNVTEINYPAIEG